ncbi:hypothetical protein Bca4012_095133 [Brassica carinata]
MEILYDTLVLLKLEGKALVFWLLSGILEYYCVSRRPLSADYVFGLIKPKAVATWIWRTRVCKPADLIVTFGLLVSQWKFSIAGSLRLDEACWDSSQETLSWFLFISGNT